jgi:hypothetical protein
MVFDPETGEYISKYEYQLKYGFPEERVGMSEAMGLTKDVADIAKSYGKDTAKDTAKEAASEVGEQAMDWSPYAKGAELTSKAIYGAIELENQARQANYLAEVAKYNAEQAKVDRATRVAQGLRA